MMTYSVNEEDKNTNKVAEIDLVVYKTLVELGFDDDQAFEEATQIVEDTDTEEEQP